MTYRMVHLHKYAETHNLKIQSILPVPKTGVEVGNDLDWLLMSMGILKGGGKYSGIQ